MIARGGGKPRAWRAIEYAGWTVIGLLWLWLSRKGGDREQ